jgi:hypothetical protein
MPNDAMGNCSLKILFIIVIYALGMLSSNDSINLDRAEALHSREWAAVNLLRTR